MRNKHFATAGVVSVAALLAATPAFAGGSHPLTPVPEPSGFVALVVAAGFLGGFGLRKPPQDRDK